jgi:MFS transporter, SP family, arabinose:H+ symporter
MSRYRYVVRVALTVAMGGFLMGFDASVISGVVKFIELQFDLGKIELGWAVSSLTLSATLAMMVAGPLSDRIGRRKVLFLAAVLYAVSAVASAFAPTFAALVVARMIGGLGVGASLIIAPMYIAEIAPPKVRGRMVSFNQLNIVVGISAAFFTNYLILRLSQSDAGWARALLFDQHEWRWMLGVETLPAVVYFIGLFFVPESPRWLLLAGREDEARAILVRAVGEDEAREEQAAIRASLARDAGREKAAVGQLFAPALRLVLSIGVVVAVVQQITGINAVFFYAPLIFEQSGIGTDASFAQAVLVGLVNLVFTVVAIALIDRLGRKPLLALGLSGITVAMLVLSFGFASATYTITDEALERLPTEVTGAGIEELRGATFGSDVEFKRALQGVLGRELAGQHESALIGAAIVTNPWLVLLGILGFVAAFAVSLGPIMWVLFSELFPNRIRGIAVSFVGLINSAVSFGVQLVFPWELANLGSATTFLIYGVFAALGLVFVVLVLPETKGRSLEELERILVKEPA